MSARPRQAAPRPGTERAGSSDSWDLIERTVTARGLPVHLDDPAVMVKLAALYRRPMAHRSRREEVAA
jgi:hypothetical protein